LKLVLPIIYNRNIKKGHSRCAVTPFLENGAPGLIRTGDLRIHSPKRVLDDFCRDYKPLKSKVGLTMCFEPIFGN
jgi:hypothetical protein